jgi:cytochrome oxidase Cu insertion factor (SCO1/SenC/PrrC family)
MSGRPDQAAPRHHRLAAAVTGVVVAAVLAAILLVGAHGGTSGTGDVAPGIDRPAAALLQLDVLGARSAAPAPNFTLTDQHGHPVSLASLRGRAVVLTFNDDRCTDLCPLLAQDVVVADRDLGSAARRVVFLSVNANPFYPQVQAVAQWTDQHGLGHVANWVYTTGSPAQLEAVWQLYGVTVEEDAATRTVVHSTGITFIDPAGRIEAVGSFGVADADTSLYGHALAQMADDLLPASQRTTVGGPTVAPASAGGATIGAPAPTFDLPRLGAPGRLGSGALRGRLTVLDFWASTCTACAGELPDIEAAHRQLGSSVAFVGVDVSDAAGRALALARRSGLDFPLVADRTGSLAGAWQIPGLPFTAVIGPGGHVLVRHPGTITTEELVYVVQSLQQQQGAAG